jgi:hypothetical protein
MAARVVAGLIRIRIGQPCHVRKKVRPFAMGAGQRSDVARKAGEALRIRVNISFDLVSGHTNLSTGITICFFAGVENSG